MSKFLTEKELTELFKKGQKEFVFPNSIKLTPAAADFIKKYNLKISFENSVKTKQTNNPKSIAIASDHTGFRAKSEIIKFLKTKNYSVEDFGTHSAEPCDYPDFAFAVAEAVASGKFDRGIIIDATGIPSSICANKVKGILSAVAINEFSIKSSREHNNSNILTCGARIFSTEYLINLIEIWLNTNFLGERHQKRLEKIFSKEK